MSLFLTTLKNNWTTRSVYFRYTIRLVVGCCLATLVYKFIDLNNGYWVVFSAIACILPTMGQSVQRIKQRLLGTFVGMWLGILIAYFFGNNIILIDILLIVFVFLTFYLKSYTYSLYAAFTTILVVLLICLSIPGDWQVAIMRLVMTVVGGIIALVTTLFILPARASDLLPSQLNALKEDLKNYYSSICQSYRSEQKGTLKVIQRQIARNLQNTFVTLQEGRLEFKDLSMRHSLSVSEYQNIAAIYEDLLLLDIHTPSHILGKDLQGIAGSLPELLQVIGSQFVEMDMTQLPSLQNQLLSLLTEVQRLRITAAQQGAAQVHFFYEHIQLTLFIETVIQLLSHLSAFHQKTAVTRTTDSK